MMFSPRQCIGDILRLQGLPALEKRMLLSHVLSLSHVQLITHSDDVLTQEQLLLLEKLWLRRLQGEPMAYIIGSRQFYDLVFELTPDVLIPRPETELLVECANERLFDGATVLDMGTGSGIIAVTLAYLRQELFVTATDISDKALQVAKHNAQRLLSDQTNICFMRSNWFDAVDRSSRFDMIVSNPPYIHRDDSHLQEGDLRFEPLNALTDHVDGLSHLQVIIENAPQFLNDSGWLLLEHGYDQAKSVCHMLKKAGFKQIQTKRDLAGIQRVSLGQYCNM